MNVLSLFDGISCGQIALNRVGIEYKNYFASEIDKHAIKVTQTNFPNTIQLGSVENWKEWNIDWSKIDLLIGGSPCQGFSSSGKGLNFEDPRSKLFFEFSNILNHIKSVNPQVKFLLENVKMKPEWCDVITECLGVNYVEINSSFFSAQNRVRYYWCNFDILPYTDKGIILSDIIETDYSANPQNMRGLKLNKAKIVGRRINERAFVKIITKTFQ
jgi:site-specific DNA-cytosine methylase